MAINKFIVGIFTREHRNVYQWLVRFLLTISIVKNVHQVVISNTFSDFQQEAGRCKFGIVYHSKRRGRVNVTDVTDSLYDKELQHLNQSYGKKKVLVVIDDLEDSSDHQKYEILQNQQSIQKLAEELFLFSTAEKALLTDTMPAGYQNGCDLGNKLGRMRKIIEGGKEFHVFGQGSRTRRVRDQRPDSESGQRTRQQRRSKWIIFGALILVIAILLIVLPITLS